MSEQQEQTSSIYTASLVASFFIGIDCFVIGMIYLIPVVGLASAILIALCGLFLNTFVYYQSGPDSLKELFAKKEKRTTLSYFINAVALLGALFVFMFTIYAYIALAAVMPFLAGWLTPFLIGTMALAYFIGTFTLNKSELSKDFLANEHGDFSIRASLRLASQFFVRTMNLESTDHYGTIIWRFISRILLPVLVACVVSLAITLAFFTGCVALLGAMGLMYLQPLVVLMACCFLFAELYFNLKQNLAMVEHICHPGIKKQQQSMFTPGMGLLILMVLANAVANGFIAMDAGVLAVSAIMFIKCISGVVQSFCTMLNTCWNYVNDPDASLDALMGGQTAEVMFQTCMVISAIAAIYLALLFNPVLLPIIAMAIILVMPMKQYMDDRLVLSNQYKSLRSVPSSALGCDPIHCLQNGSFLGDQNGERGQLPLKSTLLMECLDGIESHMSRDAGSQAQ